MGPPGPVKGFPLPLHISRPDLCTYLRWDVRRSSLFSHECRKVCRARVSYCRRFGFKSWTGGRVTWLKLLALFLSSCVSIRGQNLKLGKDCFFPPSFHISIHYLPYRSTAQSLQWLTTYWTTRGSNPGGARHFLFSIPVWSGSGIHPASCTMNTGSLLGLKRPGRGDDHPTPSSAEVDSPLSLQGILRIFIFEHSQLPTAWLNKPWINITNNENSASSLGNQQQNSRHLILHFLLGIFKHWNGH
jgi:hypothetical protein